MSLSSGPVQGRGIKFAAHGIHGGALLEEVPDDVPTIVNGRPMKQGDRFAVRLIDIPAGFNQLPYSGNGTILGGLNDIEATVIWLHGRGGGLLGDQRRLSLVVWLLTGSRDTGARSGRLAGTLVHRWLLSVAVPLGSSKRDSHCAEVLVVTSTVHPPPSSGRASERGERIEREGESRRDTPTRNSFEEFTGLSFSPEFHTAAAFSTVL